MSDRHDSNLSRLLEMVSRGRCVYSFDPTLAEGALGDGAFAIALVATRWISSISRRWRLSSPMTVAATGDEMQTVSFGRSSRGRHSARGNLEGGDYPDGGSSTGGHPGAGR